MSAAKVALGRRLFYDRALSQDRSMACADCHQQAHGFSDGQQAHVGVTGEMRMRSVAVTGPWLLDGQSDSVESAIRRHAAAQLPGIDMAALLAFLASLTDQDFLKNRAFGPPPATCPTET
ncbi:cytochrome-c peroxidase [Sphingobium sp.]|uniref:cytochrome-c peroxidase n=1 Tax=Sphingobium sp. TaxID=1912891 RepID=UPI002BF6329B|nr:cytochrome-c peroxidase [Sphingobium sp.]HUD95122.1 cytochrome-c peroxidase [Sphingobium sp.]